MANFASNPGNGSFVSRTKKNPRPSSFHKTYEVAASTTYEPTGSFKNTAFLVEAGTSYALTPADGGDDLTAGLVTGQVYNIALKKVVNGGGTVVQLIK
jgi:hypothetical protein|tara:strand:- start:1099 stop:1392 length:294 start_codon:yes stop_codon:yes gene_type:complete